MTCAMRSIAPRSGRNSAGGRAKPSKSGLRKTVRWYLDNRPWWQAIRAKTYAGQRLGVAL